MKTTDSVTTPSQKVTSKTIDGRKARWFDCDWNNDGFLQNGCAQCRICKYNDFLDFAESVRGAEGVIEYIADLDEYQKLKTLEEKQKWIIKNL